LNFYCLRTSGTFGFAASRQAIAMAKPKEPLLRAIYQFRGKQMNPIFSLL
jgi:hypothetical protein